jgi:GntR family transcriptional repressor for pyruvate dehydrogenase complex
MKTSSNKKNDFPAALSLKAVEKTKLYQQIANQIQELINNGKLRHGDQLPPERELAEIFKVSRHPVREAIRTLEQKNILRSRVGSGTYVILEDEPSVVEFIAKSIQREKEKLSDIFEFRRIIEPQIAGMAAENASPNDIKTISDILEDQLQSAGDFEELIGLDQAFHLSLAKATGNAILPRIVERINDILAESRAKYSQSSSRIKHSIKGHQKILDAICKGDKKKANQAMRRHIIEIEKMVIKKIS